MLPGATAAPRLCSQRDASTRTDPRSLQAYRGYRGRTLSSVTSPSQGIVGGLTAALTLSMPGSCYCLPPVQAQAFRYSSSSTCKYRHTYTHTGIDKSVHAHTHTSECTACYRIMIKMPVNKLLTLWHVCTHICNLPFSLAHFFVLRVAG